MDTTSTNPPTALSAYPAHTAAREPAQVSLERGDLEQARSLAEQALAVAQHHAHTWGIARSLYVMGCVAQRRGDYRAAQSLLLESLAAQRRRTDQQGLTWSLIGLAQTALSQGDAAAALQVLTEALTLAGRVGDRLGVVWGLEGRRLPGPEGRGVVRPPARR